MRSSLLAEGADEPDRPPFPKHVAKKVVAQWFLSSTLGRRPLPRNAVPELIGRRHPLARATERTPRIVCELLPSS